MIFNSNKNNFYMKIFHGKELDEIEFLLDQYVYRGSAR